jgi:hypothetical protein
LYPRAPTKNTNSFVPPKRSPTVDTRGKLKSIFKKTQLKFKNEFFNHLRGFTAFCGQANAAGRIVGGTEAVPNSLPW